MRSLIEYGGGLIKPLLEDEVLRWASSFAFVIAVYAGAILVALNWNTQGSVQAEQPMAAMMVELAPVPAAPQTPPNAAPPGPQQEEAPPPEPIPEPEPEEVLPELPLVDEAEAVLPKLEPVVEEPEPIEESPQEQMEKAPQSVDAPPDDVTAAPREGAVSLSPSQAPATWQSVLLGHLEHHKRYPREARRNREEAIVYVRVKINRDGTVVNYRLERPSKHVALNRETLELIARAQPLPPPPNEIEGESGTVEFVVPVEFFLR